MEENLTVETAEKDKKENKANEDNSSALFED